MSHAPLRARITPLIRTPGSPLYSEYSHGMRIIELSPRGLEFIPLNVIWTSYANEAQSSDRFSLDFLGISYIQEMTFRYLQNIVCFLGERNLRILPLCQRKWARCRNHDVVTYFERNTEFSIELNPVACISFDRWEFISQSGDIGWRIFRRDDRGETVDVIPWERVECDVVASKGEIVCNHLCTCKDIVNTTLSSLYQF